MSELIELTREFFRDSIHKEEFENLFELNADSIALVENLLQDKNNSVGVKRKLESELGTLLTYQSRISEKIKNFNVSQATTTTTTTTAGGGISSTSASPSSSSTTQQQQQKANSWVKWQQMQSAYKNRVKTGVIVNLHHRDPKKFLDEAGDVFKEEVAKNLRLMHACKVNVTLCCLFIKLDPNEVNKYKNDTKYFQTRNYVITKTCNIANIYANIVSQILNSLEQFEEKDSGWALNEILHLAVSINKYAPLGGGTFIPLPHSIKTKCAVLNIESTDRMCFVWAVLAGIFKNYSTNVLDYPQNYHDILNLRGITFPIKIADINKFEKQNPEISINVFGLDVKKKNEVIGPIYHTKQIRNNHINLLVLQKKNSKHFCWIYDLGRLCKTAITKHKDNLFTCSRCLCHFNSETKLKNHQVDCDKFDAVKIELPRENENILKFRSVHKQFKAPFVIFADFECLTRPISGCIRDERDPFSYHYQRHEPYSVAYQVICSTHEHLSHFNTYRGAEPEKWLIKNLQNEALLFAKYLQLNVPLIPLTAVEQETFDKADSCYLCFEKFNEFKLKVIDHNHTDGRYRGAACNSCNINYKPSNVLPIFFHNLGGYDAHLIIKALCSIDGDISLLPVTKENYISFTKCLTINVTDDDVSEEDHGNSQNVNKRKNRINIKLRFLDSFRFLYASLENLANSLDECDCKYLKSAFPNSDDFNLVRRKGVFPYDFTDSWSKLNYESLPSKEDFYSKLNDEQLTDEQYSHAVQVWNHFHIQNLGEYSDLYLKTDVLLLTDIFEKYRNVCMKSYGLDPANYFTTPSFSWDAMLKMTRVELELFTDVDMVMFVERGIRGGLVQCCKRYAKANNKYLSNYDPSKPDSYIMYFDVNNLYGYGMAEPLPYKDFSWVIDLNSLQGLIQQYVHERSGTEKKWHDDEFGYILEVTIRYPEDLHETHRDLPLLPHHFSLSKSNNEQKLMTTLYDKEKYIVHYRMLVQALQMNVELVEIHRAIKFKQSRWLKTYIDFNTKMRTETNHAFEKNLYKLKNNSIFGKSLENVRNHRDVKLVSKWEGPRGARALIAKPNFRSITIFNDDMIVVEMNKTSVKFEKPIYVGMSILDVSKWLMYDFHYNYFTQITDKCELLYMDTDSFIYQFRGNDIYEIIRRDCQLKFDTSDYPPNNVYKIPSVNKKVVGVMKDEACDIGPILEFIGLRAKMYAIKFDDKKRTVVKKAKGVGKQAKNRITFEHYKRSLFENVSFNFQFNIIQSKNHDLFTTTVNKKCLDSNDDKRTVLRDRIHTLPLGYKNNNYNISPNICSK